MAADTPAERPAESGTRRPELPEPQWETVVETRRDVAAVSIAADPDLARRSSERPAELERTLSGPPELVSRRGTASLTCTRLRNLWRGGERTLLLLLSDFIGVCLAGTCLICVNLNPAVYS